jgi:hypothetical protein
MNYPLTNITEVAGGARLGGRIVGPYNGTGRLWDGRPPVIGDESSPRVMSVSAMPTAPETSIAAPTVRDVRIEAIFANGWGDQVRRVFDLGVGVTATLNAGSFELCKVRVITDIPDGVTVFFSWNFETPGARSDEKLLQFQNYAVAGVRIPIPEGTVAIVPETAGIMSFPYPRSAATFNVAVGAGAVQPILGGTLSYSVPTDFIFIMTTP